MEEEEDAKEHKTIMRLSMRNNLPVSTTIVGIVLVSSFLPCRSLSQEDGDTTENVYLKLQPPPSLT